MAGRLSVWPPLPPSAPLRRPQPTLPFPLELPDARLFSRARHALHSGVRALGLEPGDAVLVPAYHHGSEVEVLARSGLSTRFYDVGETLEPDEAELGSSLTDDVRALYLIHYLGIPQDAQRWRRWCDDRGLLLIEDAAQAWLAARDGRPVGSDGDLAVFCLYKTFGLPDGAALISRRPPPSPSGAAGWAAAVTARRHAAWLMGRSGVATRVAGRLHRPAPYDAERDFALGDPDSPPSTATGHLLSRVVDADAAAVRRAHYDMLCNALPDDVRALVPDLPAGASPFALPVLSEAKDELLRRLGASGIDALDVWSVPHPQLDIDAFPRASSLRRRVAGLPVHQELRPVDLDRIAAALHGSRRVAPPRLEEHDGLESLASAWSELAGESGNIFATHEWAGTWWRHFGRDRPLRIRAVRGPGGRLETIVPLFLAATRPVRVLLFLGHGQGDHLGPIAPPHGRVRAAQALRRSLAGEAFEVFLGNQLPSDEGWAALLGARLLRRTGSPVADLGASWEAFLAARSSNFRQQLRRKERDLARGHDLRFRLTESPDRLAADMDTLFALHRARWSAGTSSFGGPAEPFHRAFAQVALERGWLRLWTLEIDGAAAAAWYGFRFGSAESYYQAGRDPRWDRASVGFILLAHTMREASRDGMREYQMLEGGEPFKYRFATRDPGLDLVGLGRGPLGHALVSGAASWGRHPALRAAGERFVGS